MLNEVLFQVFAMECIQKVMSACEATGDGAHFDLVKAKEKMMTDPNGMIAGFLCDVFKRRWCVNSLSVKCRYGDFRTCDKFLSLISHVELTKV